MIAVSGYMGGTRGSGVLSCASDVLQMSVVRGVCVCLVGVGLGCWSERVRGLGLGFINPGGTGGKWDVCVFWLRRCGWCWGGESGGGRFGQGLGECGGVVLSLCLL